VASYAVGRERFEGRKGDVLRWLARYWNKYQRSPTSAELAGDHGDGAKFTTTDSILYVRRGLSDLQTHGLVETVEKRKCAVTGRTCCTWRVRSR
jgi:hypothetical protein